MSTNFFSDLVKSWHLQTAEQALIELAIGIAVFDKLKGKQTSLAAAYKTIGGNDETSSKVFESVDKVFSGATYSDAAIKIAEASGYATFEAAAKAWDIAGAELALIERTLGQSYFKRLQGVLTDLTTVYASLGGSDATTNKVLSSVKPLWDNIKVASALHNISTAVA